MPSLVLIFLLCLDYGHPSELRATHTPCLVSTPATNWASSYPTGNRTTLTCWEPSDLSSPSAFQTFVSFCDHTNLRLSCSVGPVTNGPRKHFLWVESDVGLCSGLVERQHDEWWKNWVRSQQFPPNSSAPTLSPTLAKSQVSLENPISPSKPGLLWDRVQAVPMLRSLSIFQPLGLWFLTSCPQLSSGYGSSRPKPLFMTPCLWTYGTICLLSTHTDFSGLGPQCALLRILLGHLLCLLPSHPTQALSCSCSRLDRQNCIPHGTFFICFPLCFSFPEKSTCIPPPCTFTTFSSGPNWK